MKKFLKVTCLVFLSMSLFMSCAKKESIVEEMQDYSAAIEESLDEDGETADKSISMLYIDWYGDQYLEATWWRSRYGVNSDVVCAANNIVVQTNISDHDVDYHWNSWTSTKTLCHDLCDEFKSKKPGASKSHLKLGITYGRLTDHQGTADHIPGFYAVADCNPNAPTWKIYDWPDQSLFMHELCHCLNAVHCGNRCVMKYFYAAQGSTTLCSACKNRINTYI